MARNSFAFLDSESPERRVLLLLLAILRKQGGEISLDLSDLTSIDDGASFHKIPDDTGTKLVLRFARRGAEAFFLTEGEVSTPAKYRSTVRPATPVRPLDETQSRHAIHSDIDLALREEEIAQRVAEVNRQRLNQARAEAGAMPWRTVKPQ